MHARDASQHVKSSLKDRGKQMVEQGKTRTVDVESSQGQRILERLSLFFFLSTLIPANVYGYNAKMSIFLKNLNQAIATLSKEIREQKKTRLKTSKSKHTPLER